MKTEISVFQFERFRDFLESVLASSIANQRTTLSKLTTMLGYSSQRSLGMVLNGQRFPSLRMIERISEQFKLNPQEDKYLKLIVEAEKAKSKNSVFSPKEIESIYKSMDEMRFKNCEQGYSIDIDQFRHISVWFHLVIKQLVSTPKFQEDYDMLS
ncbi:MAG: TIGR02147 family protein, partial [Bdellovibrionota bacterium]